MAESDEEMNVNNVAQEDLLFGPWDQQRVFHVGTACPGMRLRGNGLYECRSDNENYPEDQEESTHILLASLQGNSEIVKDLQNKCALYQRQAKAFLEKLREVTDLWVAAFESTKIASEEAVDALNQAMELVNDEGEDEIVFTDTETEDEDFRGPDHQDDDNDDDEEDNDDNRPNRIADQQGSPYLVFLRNNLPQQGNNEEVEEDNALGDAEPEEEEPFRISTVKRRLEYSDESAEDDSDRSSKRRRSESNDGTLSLPSEESEEDIEHPVNVHQMSPSPTPSPESSRSGASSRRSSRSVSSRSNRSRDSQTPHQSPSPSPPPPSPVVPRSSRRNMDTSVATMTEK